MFRTVATVLVALLASTAGFTAHAAEIDCDKAQSTVERMICSDQWLLDLDFEIAHTYKTLLSESTNSVAREIEISQRLWISNTRDKCGDKDCLIAVHHSRRWELAEKLQNFDCDDFARTTVEIDNCGSIKLKELDKRMQAKFQALIKKLESPDCCDSMDHIRARDLAIESQNFWLKFRDSECWGHFETISGGTLRGSIRNACARSLTEARIEQLSHWGVVDVKDDQFDDIKGAQQQSRVKK